MYMYIFLTRKWYSKIIFSWLSTFSRIKRSFWHTLSAGCDCSLELSSSEWTLFIFCLLHGPYPEISLLPDCFLYFRNSLWGFKCRCSLLLLIRNLLSAWETFGNITTVYNILLYNIRFHGEWCILFISRAGFLRG